MAEPKSNKTKEFFEQQKKQEEEQNEALQNEALENEEIENEEVDNEESENGEESSDKTESEEAKENDNENDDKNKKEKGTSWFFWVFIGTLVVILAILVAKIKLTMFTSRPELFGKYFYTWRIQEADDIMVKGTGYNKIKLNTIDPKNKNALNFRKMAEEETFKFPIFGNDPTNKNEVEIKGLISSFKINEHMPRGPAGQHTLVDENNFTFYYELLKLKASAILNLGPNKLEDDQQNKSKAFVLKETRIKESNFPINHILKELDSKNTLNKTPTKFYELRDEFFSLLRSVYNKDTGYSLTDKNTKLGGELFKEANKIINKVYPQDISGNKKINEKEIKDFFYNFGTVLNVTAIQSLIYSRMFSFFYICTLNVKLEEIELTDTKRPFHVARMFAKIFSRVFEHDWSYSIDSAKISWIEKTLGKKTSCDYSNPKIKESYKSAMNVDNKNIEALLKVGSKK